MNHFFKSKCLNCFAFLLLTCLPSTAQIILMGGNPPFENINDGDFSSIWDYWRNASQSPFWTTQIIKGDAPMGLRYGTLFSSNTIGIASSKLLNNTTYQHPKMGDKLHWNFGADLEYNCKGSISLSLVFGKQERLLINKALNYINEYQVQRNLSGVQLQDGSMLFITKFGRMIKSNNGLLGPYKVLTDVIQKNETIPERYRKSNYEDPTMWRDEVQFHCLINAFIDKRAIYLRSPDGIHWKFDSGIAYDTSITSYQNGTSTHWHKLERPHVLQDQFGRATHLSLAALDVAKKNDMANDNHNSKNIIFPLTVHKRIKLLNKEKIDPHTKTIKLLILSENGFDAQKDIDISSLRFGASEEVNFSRGCQVITTQNKGKDLILEFTGKGNGITSTNFAGKLLGKTTKGDLLIGFCKLVAH